MLPLLHHFSLLSPTMPITNTQRDQIHAATIVMFGIPSGGFADALESILTVRNGNTAQLIQDLARLPVFQSLFAGTPDVVATKLANAYGFASTTGGLGQQIKTFFLDNLNGGLSVPALIHAANEFFLNTTSPVLADAKSAFLNKIEVANFYTYGVQGQSQDLATLQQVLAGVNSNASSVTSAKLLLAQAAANDTPSQSLTAGHDTYFGTAGADRVDGLAGNDAMDGADGNDFLQGGIGNDVLNGGRGRDVLVGGSGDDKLTAGSYWTNSYDYATNRTIYTYDAHSEVLQGGDGADTLYGGYGSDVLDGGTGADTIYGDDNVYYGSYATADQLKTMFNDVILGGDGADRIFGGEGVDWIDAGPGNDTADLGSGGGHLEGGDGDDRLFGSRGNDEIWGQSGNDTIYLSDDGSNDTASGGDGNDTITATSRDSGTLTLSGDAGNDNINVKYGTASANISLGDGTDTVQLGNGVYTINMAEAVAARDVLDISSSTPTNAVSISTATGFNVSTDVLDIGNFNLWGYSGGSVSEGYSASYSGTKIRTFVQKLSSPDTPFQGPTGASASSYVNGQTIYNLDFAGKGLFIVTGASAAAADTATVANFLNPYGNNATYGVSKVYYFVVDIAGQGAGVYRFKDDTNGDNNLIADELTPLLLLTGVSAASLNDINFI